MESFQWNQEFYAQIQVHQRSKTITLHLDYPTQYDNES